MTRKILCTICARKGSKGLKNKNMKILKGKPLIFHTIKQAINSGIFNKIVVSTDSKKILDRSKKIGAEGWFIRPRKLSTSYASKLSVVRHCLKEAEKKFHIKFDSIIDLDVTSPLRNISDIKNAFNLFLKKKAHNLVSCTESRKNPYFNIVEYCEKKKIGVKVVKKTIKKIIRRQSAPQTYDLNASIYIWKRNILLKSKSLLNNKTVLFKMPPERSIDIDDEFDFNLVKYLKK